RGDDAVSEAEERPDHAAGREARAQARGDAAGRRGADSVHPGEPTPFREGHARADSGEAVRGAVSLALPLARRLRAGEPDAAGAAGVRESILHLEPIAVDAEAPRERASPRAFAVAVRERRAHEDRPVAHLDLGDEVERARDARVREREHAAAQDARGSEQGL